MNIIIELCGIRYEKKNQTNLNLISSELIKKLYYYISYFLQFFARNKWDLKVKKKKKIGEDKNIINFQKMPYLLNKMEIELVYLIIDYFIMILLLIDIK